ncbi:uncharacterized protein LOC111265815 isoform X2 [Varroa jacobsoni]|uniref:uncharacterized protein LOC111265815 isoform X2 n=1 Tax=Varroa jacobsoni TaxID=62625 RepID=UPI000BF5CBA0|nr:uncharacterized protein LOC111265815 isoform X2 [Varroa jacobsoni]
MRSTKQPIEKILVYISGFSPNPYDTLSKCYEGFKFSRMGIWAYKRPTYFSTSIFVPYEDICLRGSAHTEIIIKKVNIRTTHAIGPDPGSQTEDITIWMVGN